jgi:anti-anti-sigma factor
MAEFACGAVDGVGGGPVVLIWATGEIGPAAAARLGAEIEPYLNRGAIVVMTCAGITGIDPAGLGVLLHVQRTAIGAGAVFWLASIPQTIAKTIQNAGLGLAFTVHDSVAEALTEAGHPQHGGRGQGPRLA